MENIYTQAIADAKAVRESAMANAKAAIQEAFEPKIKAMLKKHIVENEGLEEEIDETEDMEEMYGHKEEGMDHEGMEEEYKEYDETMSPADEAAPTTMDEKTLDEILAELDSLEEADEVEEATEELEEAFEMEEAKEEEEEETEEETEETEEGEGEEESTEETKVVDITLGDLVDAIKAAMAGETPAATEEPSGTEMEPASDDISLDEILAELEEEMKEEGAGSGDYMDEAKKKKAEAMKKAKEDEAKEELKEAKKAIEAMRAELNEVNLLNAKLLYVNKIFKAKSLTEAQKVKVLNAFDKATTVKEVKNTYSIVSEAITAAPKKQLKESFGFASKPAGVAPKTNTMESDPFIARMQKLAGL